MSISQHNSKRTTTRGALVLAIALVAMIFTGCNSSEQSALSQSLLNGERQSAGLGALSSDPTAGAKAQAWADHMAAVFATGHSKLTDGMGSDWNYLGENVGYGSSVSEVHKALMKSTSHRNTIMASKYTSVGVGVAERDGYVFVAQVFKG